MRVTNGGEANARYLMVSLISPEGQRLSEPVRAKEGLPTEKDVPLRLRLPRSRVPPRTAIVHALLAWGRCLRSRPPEGLGPSSAARPRAGESGDSARVILRSRDIRPRARPGRRVGARRGTALSRARGDSRAWIRDHLAWLRSALRGVAPERQPVRSKYGCGVGVVLRAARRC